MHIGPSPPPQLVREGLKPVLQAPHADEPDEQLSLLASLQTFFAAALQTSTPAERDRYSGTPRWGVVGFDKAWEVCKGGQELQRLQQTHPRCSAQVKGQRIDRGLACEASEGGAGVQAQ